MSELVSDAVHSHFEDLERFMAHWQDDPIGFCNFTGRAIARIGNRNFNDLFFAIGTSYFAFHDLADRIDHIIDNPDVRIGGIKGKTIAEMIDIDVNEDVICVRDKYGRHKNMKLTIWRQSYEGNLTYFLRPVDGSENDISFEGCDAWNFRRAEDITEGVIVYPEARGFYDLTETKSVADLIVLASNWVGFVGCEC